MSRVLAFRVVVDRLTCGDQLNKEVSPNGVFIGNLVHGGIRDVCDATPQIADATEPFLHHISICV